LPRGFAEMEDAEMAEVLRGQFLNKKKNEAARE
jgi:hypothetical protein